LRSARGGGGRRDPFRQQVLLGVVVHAIRRAQRKPRTARARPGFSKPTRQRRFELVEFDAREPERLGQHGIPAADECLPVSFDGELVAATIHLVGEEAGFSAVEVQLDVQRGDVRMETALEDLRRMSRTADGSSVASWAAVDRARSFLVCLAAIGMRPWPA
jgi:hypothetical protein